MSNNAMGGRAKGKVSDEVERESNLAQAKRQEAAKRLYDFVNALGREDEAGAEQALAAGAAAAREAVRAEKRAQQLQDTLDEARAHAPDLGAWRDALAKAFVS